MWVTEVPFSGAFQLYHEAIHVGPAFPKYLTSDAVIYCTIRAVRMAA